MKMEQLLFSTMLTCFCSLAVSAFAQQEEQITPPPASYSFIDALKDGQVKALFRYNGQNRNSTLHVLQDSSEPDVPNKKLQYYSAIGGLLGYETAPWFHTKFGATVYAALPFGNNPANRRGLGG
jgi:hypothetical protein